LHLTTTDTRVLAAQNEIECLQKLIGTLRKKYYDCNDTILDIQRFHVEESAKKTLEKSKGNTEKPNGNSEKGNHTTAKGNGNAEEEKNQTTKNDLWEGDDVFDWAEDPME